MTLKHIPFSSRSQRRLDTTAALTAKAQRARLVPVKEAVAVARPNTVPQTYLEMESDELAVEQLREHAAVGEQEAAKPAVTAAGLQPAREAGHSLIAINAGLATGARDRYVQVVALLGPLAKRKAGARWGYFLCLVMLLLGDIAGLGGAAIAYGEVPMLAIMQATSASFATVIAGTVGAEFKHLKAARERRFGGGELTTELEPYRALLLGPLIARPYVLVASLISLLVAVFIAVGIFALRASVEGQVSAYVFGGLAIGIALGSWANSFRYADSVADKIEAARHEYRRELRTHARMTRSWRLPQAERAIKQAQVVRDQHRLHGEAAAAKVAALKFEALQQSPDVVGHGLGTGEIGRKPRSAPKAEPKKKTS